MFNFLKDTFSYLHKRVRDYIIQQEHDAIIIETNKMKHKINSMLVALEFKQQQETGMTSI